MSYARLSNEEYETYYNKFTKGFRIGDKVKSFHGDKIISSFTFGSSDTLDDFLSTSTIEEIHFAIDNILYAFDSNGVSLGSVNNLEIVDDGLYSFDDYERDNTVIQTYPEVDEFLKNII